MTRSPALGLVALTLLGVLGPSLASARAAAIEEPPRPRRLGPSVVGPATLDEVSLRVDCGSPRPRRAECQVVLAYRVVASGPDSVLLSTTRRRPDEVAVEATVLVDGEPRADVTLAPGESRRVLVTAAVPLEVTEAPEDSWFISPMQLRHPLLGESRWVRRLAGGFDATFGPDAQLAVSSVEVDARHAAPVRVFAGRREVDGRRVVEGALPTVSLVLDAPSEDRPVLHGGPILMLGAVSHPVAGETEQDADFTLGVGYEIGLEDWLFASAEISTDFHSAYEALVLEAATPWALILPSVGAGVGVVGRQFGGRPPDGAVRVRMLFGMYVVGMTLDVDYWPAADEVTMTMRVRASL